MEAFRLRREVPAPMQEKRRSPISRMIPAHIYEEHARRLVLRDVS